MTTWKLPSFGGDWVEADSANLFWHVNALECFYLCSQLEPLVGAFDKIHALHN